MPRDGLVLSNFDGDRVGRAMGFEENKTPALNPFLTFLFCLYYETD